MANLKVFVSSTCYDLQAIRAQLRSMLSALGYEPVLSDQADVIYDPRLHTHSSCLREVENCDLMILVVGSRFGGSAIPKALELLDLEHLSDLSRAEKFGEDKSKISVTQAEVLQAIQVGIPVFAFVDTGIMRDHLTYEKNKNKSIIGQIDFSSIDKKETAPYIFEFINFLRLRNENNSIFEFARFEEIELQLKKQWSGLFQRLLHEQRNKSIEVRRIDNLSGQIADLKAAVLGSISSSELKETAKGAIQFRHLIDFTYSLAIEVRPNDAMDLINSDIPWRDLLRLLDITNVYADESRSRVSGVGLILVRTDGTYFQARTSPRALAQMSRDWDEFRKLGTEAKSAILAAILDSRSSRFGMLVRFHNEQYSASESTSSDDEQESELPAVKDWLDAIGKTDVVDKNANESNQAITDEVAGNPGEIPAHGSHQRDDSSQNG